MRWFFYKLVNWQNRREISATKKQASKQNEKINHYICGRLVRLLYSSKVKSKPKSLKVMQIFSTIFISFILIFPSPNVFAIKISKETIDQGRQLIGDINSRGTQFLELAERVQTIIKSHGPQSIFIIIPHLVSMNESIEKVVSSLSISQAYLTSLRTTVESDPE
ncbi:hypothetical protein, partial [Endozoicomonas sp. SESOKO2]|uniref:hypothetical protein n=1 Tax=Endozoicomonas sp. SESOKO2 TaxID=2828743 RepID=UPI002147CEBA